MIKVLTACTQAEKEDEPFAQGQADGTRTAGDNTKPATSQATHDKDGSHKRGPGGATGMAAVAAAVAAAAMVGAAAVTDERIASATTSPSLSSSDTKSMTSEAVVRDDRDEKNVAMERTGASGMLGARLGRLAGAACKSGSAWAAAAACWVARCRFRPANQLPSLLLGRYEREAKQVGLKAVLG